MKNIHILPTDKPSRLSIKPSKLSILNNGKLNFGAEFISSSNAIAQHIYITNDEEIKEGDWFLTDDKRVEKCVPDWRAREWHKKIILTTDQDLIKDGVQTIDDKFLEWFVKNPSCEYVVVKYQYWKEINDVGKYTYKIIIPKEEPTIVRLPTYYEPKQETLEEVAEKSSLYNEIYSIVKQIPRKDVDGDAMDVISCAYEIEQLFYEWQQEQSYSEEDMEIVEISSIDANYIPHYQTKEGQLLATKFNVEQFKKK
jgi:hypothetical protein